MKPLCLLVIEDNELQQEMLVRLFDGNKSVIVRLAGSLKEAQQHVASCDFVVIDLFLPDSTPEQTLAWLADCHKPSIVVSGSFDDETLEQAARAGAFAFLPKSHLADQIAATAKFEAFKFNLACEECQEQRDKIRCIAERLQKKVSQALSDPEISIPCSITK